MQCKGCYKEVKDGYCLSCRKSMFRGLRTSPVLPFETPKDENLISFQEHSKRLSISGVQLKYSLRLENKTLVLTEKGGEYILKPIPPAQQLFHVDQVPENEHLTMQIAKQIFNIPTAENVLIHFQDGTPAYLTKRFDVAADGTKYLQEDFAQLTSRTSKTHGETFKYQGSYEEIGVLIQKFVPASIIAAERFFHQVVFNYIFSNGDAHLKNFSLYRTQEREYQLTPAYDLLTTVIHSPVESDTALDLYEGDLQSAFYSQYGFYGRPNFLELAKRLLIQPSRAERILDSYPAAFEKVKRMVANSFLNEAIKEKYISNVTDKMGRLAIS
ncbi:MAG: HipA domain-containing protein [Chitinophagaceae bacterium]|nr:HipA domain-containing protein [Chitinophagaceae bacterium]